RPPTYRRCAPVARTTPPWKPPPGVIAPWSTTSSPTIIVTARTRYAASRVESSTRPVAGPSSSCSCSPGRRSTATPTTEPSMIVSSPNVSMPRWSKFTAETTFAVPCCTAAGTAWSRYGWCFPPNAGMSRKTRTSIAATHPPPMMNSTMRVSRVTGSPRRPDLPDREHHHQRDDRSADPELRERDVGRLQRDEQHREDDPEHRQRDRLSLRVVRHDD